MIRFDGHPLRLNSIGRLRCPPGWSLTPNRTRAWQDLDLWFLLDGHGRVLTPHGEHPLTPGACLILRGGTDYTFIRDGRRPFAHYFAHFDLLDRRRRPIPPARAPVPGLYRNVADPDLLEHLLHRAVAARQQAQPDDCAETWFAAALLEVAEQDRRQRVHDARDASNLTPTDDELEDLCDRITDNPSQRLVIAEEARRMGCSRSQLFRRFVERTGRSPQRFMVENRMRWARAMLLDSDNQVGWIAVQLGYRDIYFFSRQFKQHHGCAPQTYRRQAG